MKPACSRGAATSAFRVVLGIALAVLGSAWEATPLQAQAGRVVDADTGAPLVGAEVVWVTAGGALVSSTATDGDGRFGVRDGWQGDGRLRVGTLGYQTRFLSRDEAAAAGWRIVLAPDPLDLDDVVVTVAGRTQSRSEVAVPVQRVTAREIRTSGAESVETLLAEMPGLQAMPGVPTGSNIMIRGIGDSRVLILVDGQPASGALLEDRDLSRLSLSGVERVEVVKGPLSSLYGSDALGGVINIITKEPERGFRMDARMLQGNQGRQEAGVTVSGGDAVSYRITGSWREQNRVPGLAPELDAFSRVWDMRSTVRYGEQDGLQLRSDISVLRERQKWPVGGGFSGFNDNRGISGWGEVRYPALGGSVFARVLGQDYYHLFRSARGDNPIAGADDDRQEERLLRGTVGWSASLGSHGVDAGVDYFQREIASPDKLLEDRASDSQVEFYAQDAWRIGTTTLSSGFRATFNDRWGEAFSPTLGVSSLVADDFRLRASLGRGFRAPSFKELAWDFANLGGGYTIQGFAGLRPERSWNVSSGVEWAPSARLSMEVEAFRNEIDNLIEFSFVGNSVSGLLILSPRNVSRAITQGVEAGFDYRRGRWRLAGNYAFLDTEALATGLPLDRRARHSARVSLGRDFNVLAGLSVDVDGHMTGDAALVGTGESGDPEIIGTQERLISLDMQVGLDMVNGVQLILGGDNLFDSRPEGWQGLFGRRFRVGVEATDLF